MNKHKVLVTGGAGFIGSEFVKQIIKKKYTVVVADKITYAGDLERLREVKGQYKFYKQDLYNKKQLEKVVEEERPSHLVHFAAESHVDRSIIDAGVFIKTNVFGTQILLDITKKYPIERFIHISTDEVYGDIDEGESHENTPLNPSSPYSASKAAADLLVKSYIRTYNIPAIIVRPSNNYGPWQYPEKFIPVVIYKALKNEKIPVYAQGQNVREWLYVSDCAHAIVTIMENGKLGEVYNIGSGIEKKNLDVVENILKKTKKPLDLIEFVKDRPGHDYRYRLNSLKIKNELHWNAKVDFENGIHQTIAWYEENMKWLGNKVTYLESYWKNIYKSNELSASGKISKS